MTAISGADPNMEVRLEQIKGAIDVGNAQTKGQLDLLIQRLDHNEKLADERERRAAAELKERDTRLDKVEAGQAAMQKQQDKQARKLAFFAGGISALGVATNIGVQVLLHH